MFRCTDIQSHTTNVALMHRSHHLGNHWESYFLGKGDEFLFRGAYHLRYQWDTRTGEYFTNNIRCQITTFDTLKLQALNLSKNDFVKA